MKATIFLTDKATHLVSNELLVAPTQTELVHTINQLYGREGKLSDSRTLIEIRFINPTEEQPTDYPL